MTRFLTPSKIGLLALIELYTDAVVPTASTIPILSFIINQLLPATLKSQSSDSAVPSQSSASSSLPFILDLKSFETLLTPHAAASGLPGRTLWDHFLTKLWAIDSLHALHEFFATRSNLLARTRDEIKKDEEMGLPPPSPDVIYLSRTSPFGSFVRRAKVEFDRLDFNTAQVLWTSFVRWRAESKSYMARRSGVMGRWAGDQALADGVEEWGVEATEMLDLIANGGLSLQDPGEGCVSTDDVEKLLEFQVERMQSKFSS
jgi:anaphase-promoting complex subunit 5